MCVCLCVTVCIHVSEFVCECTCACVRACVYVLTLTAFRTHTAVADAAVTPEGAWKVDAHLLTPVQLSIVTLVDI